LLIPPLFLSGMPPGRDLGEHVDHPGNGHGHRLFLFEGEVTHVYLAGRFPFTPPKREYYVAIPHTLFQCDLIVPLFDLPAPIILGGPVCTTSFFYSLGPSENFLLVCQLWGLKGTSSVAYHFPSKPEVFFYFRGFR